MSNTLTHLSEETKGLVDKVNQLEMIDPRNKPKKKSAKRHKRTAGKKSKTAKKSATKKKATRTRSKLGKKAPEKKRIKMRRGLIPH